MAGKHLGFYAGDHPDAKVDIPLRVLQCYTGEDTRPT